MSHCIFFAIVDKNCKNESKLSELQPCCKFWVISNFSAYHFCFDSCSVQECLSSSPGARNSAGKMSEFQEDLLYFRVLLFLPVLKVVYYGGTSFAHPSKQVLPPVSFPLTPQNTLKWWKYLFSPRNSTTFIREHDSFIVIAIIKNQHSLRVEETLLLLPVKATTWVIESCWKDIFRKAIPKIGNFLYLMNVLFH